MKILEAQNQRWDTGSLLLIYRQLHCFASIGCRDENNSLPCVGQFLAKLCGRPFPLNKGYKPINVIVANTNNFWLLGDKQARWIAYTMV